MFELVRRHFGTILSKRPDPIDRNPSEGIAHRALSLSGSKAWSLEPVYLPPCNGGFVSQPASRTRSPLLAQKLPALPPFIHRHGPLRKKIHIVCFLIFLVLPFTNLMRFDIPHQRFYFAGFELLISEFSTLFFALMFLMFLLAAGAIVYGRIYCSYLCPQMIFSEWSVGTERRVGSFIQKFASNLNPPVRKGVAKGIFLGILALASLGLAFTFTAYFVPPLDLLHRLLRFDLVTAGGITGAVVTLLTFLDFTLVRHRFCTTICPYGYMQGMLQDKHSLLVAYRDETSVCIDCRKCVNVCEMGIDIRDSPFQIECVHCGDCVDACEDVLRKLGHEGLVHYVWGDAESGKGQESLARRMGFRDAKRWAILVVALCYFTALGVTLWRRKPVLVRVAADRATLFTRLSDGRIENKVRLNLANRTNRPEWVRVWVEGLPQADVVLEPNPIPLAPGASLEQTFAIRAPRFPNAQDVNPIRVMTQSSDGKVPEVCEMSFIMPVPGAP
jgi:polyferredoxin